MAREAQQAPHSPSLILNLAFTDQMPTELLQPFCSTDTARPTLLADVNERLERENASLKAERDHLNKELSAICTLADACEVIRAMREAIKMAWRIIEPYSDSSRSNGHLPMCPECHRVAAWDEEHKEDCVIGNALAALQPFIPTNCGQSADTPPESAPNSNPS